VGLILQQSSGEQTVFAQKWRLLRRRENAKLAMATKLTMVATKLKMVATKLKMVATKLKMVAAKLKMVAESVPSRRDTNEQRSSDVRRGRLKHKSSATGHIHIIRGL
jgi:hypothetical protein